MKNLFRNIFLVSCLLLTVGAVEAQAQSVAKKPTITRGDGKALTANKPNKNVAAPTSAKTTTVKSTAVVTTAAKPTLTRGDGKALTANKPNKNVAAPTNTDTKLDNANRKSYLNAKTNAEKKQALQKWATETTNPNIQKRIQSMLSKLPN